MVKLENQRDILQGTILDTSLSPAQALKSHLLAAQLIAEEMVNETTDPLRSMAGKSIVTLVDTILKQLEMVEPGLSTVQSDPVALATLANEIHERLVEFARLAEEQKNSTTVLQSATGVTPEELRVAQTAMKAALAAIKAGYGTQAQGVSSPKPDTDAPAPRSSDFKDGAQEPHSEVASAADVLSRLRQIKGSLKLVS